MRVEPLEGRTLGQELEGLHPASFGWALVCCAWDRQAAEDVLQAAYLKAIAGHARFNGHSSTQTWFFGVVRQTARETWRRRLTRRRALDRWLAEPPPSPVPTPERLSAAAETQLRLRRGLARLSRRQRELLHLVFYESMTIEQAAEVLHLRLGTARTHYERGKARLRELLSSAGELP